MDRLNSNFFRIRVKFIRWRGGSELVEANSSYPILKDACFLAGFFFAFFVAVYSFKLIYNKIKIAIAIDVVSNIVGNIFCNRRIIFEFTLWSSLIRCLLCHFAVVYHFY